MKQKLIKYIQESILHDRVRLQLLEAIINPNDVEAEVMETRRKDILERIEEGNALLDEVNLLP